MARGNRMARAPRGGRLLGRRLLRLVRPAPVHERRGHDLGRLAVLTAVAALAAAATAAAASAPVDVPAAHVHLTLEPDGVVDVLEEIDLRAATSFAARR